jgi:hypothetical protein
MIGIHVSKKCYNVLLDNYKMVEKEGKTVVCILLVLLLYYVCSTYGIIRTGLNESYIIL